VSILVGAGESARVEMATIGNEGVVGAYSALNAAHAIGDNIVQVAGEAMRLEIAHFNHYLQESSSFHQLMHRYLFALTRQIVQAGACNRLHTMEERCARWLLMMHDRTRADTFPLTQEFLSDMLGVRRATVNLTLGILKAAALIRYVRGQITILDRTGLEAASCPRYELIRQEFQQL